MIPTLRLLIDIPNYNTVNDDNNIGFWLWLVSVATVVQYFKGLFSLLDFCLIFRGFAQYETDWALLHMLVHLSSVLKLSLVRFSWALV